MKQTLFVLMTLLIMVSCKKKAIDPAEANATNSVHIELEHVFGDEAFNLNTTTYYIADNEDSLIFTSFRYYISNIRFKRTDGTYWNQPNSYYLIDKGETGSATIEIAEVPADEYTALEYTVGVDSTHNVSGAKEGALATSNGMFWSWNSGYIFLKAEGSYRHGTGSSGNFVYHVGGFKNSNGSNAIQVVTHDLSNESLTVSKSVAPEIHLSVNVAAMFNGGAMTISVPATPTIHMPGATAVSISNNYAEMFELEHIHQ